MLQQLIRFDRHSTTVDFMIKLLLSCLLLCVGSPWVIYLPHELPLTLQTFFVLLVSISFGWKIGSLSTLLYLLIGALGVPVFPGHISGFEPFIGIFGGFFFGLLTGSLLCGFLAEIPAMQKLFPHLLIWIFGHFIILLLGAIWLRQLNPLEWDKMVFSTWRGLGAKSAAGFFIIQTTRRIIMRRKTSH